MKRYTEITIEEALSRWGILYTVRVGNEQLRILSIGGGMRVPLNDDAALKLEIIENPEKEKLQNEDNRSEM